MVRSKKIWHVAGMALSLALFGCMKSSQDPSSVVSANGNPASIKGLDANHGGARLVLPAINAAALRKQGIDTSVFDTTRVDTLPMAWFELTVSGFDMSDMVFRYPLFTNASNTFEIQAIPSGKGRSFHGRLLDGGYRLLYEGTTLADIRGGEYTDVRLYLTKASGTAGVCVVIEGQKVPDCALDSLPPVPTPPLASHCWYIGSDSINGTLHLYDAYVNGYVGYLLTWDGHQLPVTTWAHLGDTLSVVVIKPSMTSKWQLSGPVQSGSFWSGSVIGGPLESPFSFYGKPAPCPQDTTVTPPIDTVRPPVDSVPVPIDSLPPPPKDTLKAGAIPSLRSSRSETTLCFEMRLDYAAGCGTYGFAKMSFLNGNIVKGYITIADRPSRSYSEVLGSYDESSIHIESVLPGMSLATGDSLMYDGAISIDRTMAKGSYIRLPAEKKGVWTMTSIVCANWTAKYSDSSCVVPNKIPTVK